MGRQAITPSADYRRLKTYLLCVVGTVLLLASARAGIQKALATSVPVVAPPAVAPVTIPPPPKRTYRPIVAPTGSFTPKLHRSEYNNNLLVDLNDRGDYLFLSSPLSADYRQYVHIFNGKSVQSEKVPLNDRWVLTKSGKIVKLRDALSLGQPGRVNTGLTGWTYNDLRFIRRYTDDGELIYVNTSYSKKVITSKLMKEKFGSPSKIFLTSHSPLLLLEIDEKESIYVKETRDPKHGTDDRLLKVSGEHIEEISFPDGYKSVDRVAATGPILAATFGNITGKDPIRSYVKTKDSWQELPIPPGFMFSYVQRVFENGVILGFVTDENRVNMHQVVWHGNAVSILNDQPAWPKLGQYSLIARANRKGDIYVRSVLNAETGTIENYLLNVGL